MLPFLFINTVMNSFKKYLHESSVSYGDVTPEINKEDPNDPLTLHFHNTGLIKKYHDMPHPSDEDTVGEINYLKGRMDTLSNDDLEFAKRSEVDETESYRKFLKDIGINLSPDFIPNILKQTDPILFHLKNKHDRARPEQFAKAFNIPFNAGIPTTAMHGAYPSGHALDSYILGHYLGELFPEKAEQIKQFASRMRESRLDAGLHYPSDNVISKHLANDIIKTNMVKVPGVNV